MVEEGPVFFADVSYYQPLYTSAYSAVRDVIAFRGDSGYGTDGDVVENWRRIEADLDSHALAGGIVYVVYIPSANPDIMSRLKGVFGGTPDPRLAWMIDMESGTGFAGPGNHSSGANALASSLAAWCGSTKKVVGYANGGDWARCWPTPPSWMPKSKRFIAQYGGTTPAGYFAWQYTNGQVGNQYGYPLSSPPFGRCDHNVYLGTGGLVGMLTTLGIGEDVALTDDDIAKVAAKVWAYQIHLTNDASTPLTPTNDFLQSTLARVKNLETDMDKAKATAAKDRDDILSAIAAIEVPPSVPGQPASGNYTFNPS